MSRKINAAILGVFGIAAAAAIFSVLPAQGGAKPATALSLMASFEPNWIDGSDNRIRNDVDGTVYANMPSTRKAFYGVDVTYTPTQGSFPSQFVMKVDKSGLLGRSVKFNFQDPSTDPLCDDSDLPDVPIDPLQGGAGGELETRRIEISTWTILARTAEGMLYRDLNQSLDMDKMRAGDKKFVTLHIEFTPTDPLFDREYFLGVLKMDGTPCSDSYALLGGPAEILCTATGSMWEIRPTTETFVNEPDNVRRLLHTEYQLDWLNSIELRTWRLPFILKIWK